MFSLEELDELEQQLYSEEEYAELQRRREADPDGIHYIRVTCVYTRMGMPERDPLRYACQDCSKALMEKIHEYAG